MARSKQSVQESREVLISLEQKYHDPAQLIRLRMLQELQEDPSRTLTDVAAIINSSERTVQRWWGIYCAEGLEAMMEILPRGGRKPKRIGDAELQALQQKARNGGFRKLDEARHWLNQEHGVNYSRSGLWYVMQAKADLGRELPGAQIPVSMPDKSTAISAAAVPTPPDCHHPVPVSGPIPPHIIKFLNALPTAGGDEWVSQFGEALRALLGDVDRISLNVNIKCSLDASSNYRPDTVISQFSSADADSDPSRVVTSDQSDILGSERMLTYSRHSFPFESYQEPHCFDYTYGQGAFLGSMILWREINKPPISQETLQTMSALEPFILFIFSDFVARHGSQRPIDDVFYEAVKEMVNDGHLSKQEKKIAILRLMGHSYKALADNLFISIDTVKKHLTQIHRKTETNGMAELFAKYFSARLFPRDFTD